MITMGAILYVVFVANIFSCSYALNRVKLRHSSLEMLTVYTSFRYTIGREVYHDDLFIYLFFVPVCVTYASSNCSCNLRLCVCIYLYIW